MNAEYEFKVGEDGEYELWHEDRQVGTILFYPDAVYVAAALAYYRTRPQLEAV